MLHSLTLANVQLDDAAMPALTSFLRTTPYIGELSLADNFLTSDGMIVLSEILPHCEYLTKIDLGDQ